MTKNVYMKLQEARVNLQNLNLKMSGNNTYAGYKYWETSDFMPSVNILFEELKLFSRISFTSELATLTIINSENPTEQIEFTCPMSNASLKGCHEVQNLGAVISYSKRYLLMNAMELVESDALDKTLGKEEKTPQNNGQASSSPTNKKASDKQIKFLKDKLSSVSKKKNLSQEDIISKFGIKMEQIESLSSVNAKKVIDKLQEWDA